MFHSTSPLNYQIIDYFYFVINPMIGITVQLFILNRKIHLINLISIHSLILFKFIYVFS